MINSTMKHYQSILFALCGLLLLTLGMLVYQVYDSGMGGRERCKQEAELSLKSAAELWVNREFDKLGMPFYYEGGSPEAKSKRRRIVLAEGEFFVDIDSVKEAKRLFTSWMLGTKVNCLLLTNPSSVDILNESWQKSLHKIQTHCASAVKVQLEFPDGEKEQLMAGDSMLIVDKYKLGDYYFDDMYFLKLSAYLVVPSLCLCVDWGETEILVCLIIVLFSLCAFAFVFLYNKKKRKSGKKYNSDDLVSYLSEKKYQIGKVIFDEEALTLTFTDQSVSRCSSQTYKLISAFVHAENHFLSNEQIVEICDWVPDETGVSERRRVAISQLRKLLDKHKSHVTLKSGENDKKEIGIYLCVEG